MGVLLFIMRMEIDIIRYEWIGVGWQACSPFRGAGVQNGGWGQEVLADESERLRGKIPAPVFLPSKLHVRVSDLDPGLLKEAGLPENNQHRGGRLLSRL
jgi:hypothetical protein